MPSLPLPTAPAGGSGGDLRRAKPGEQEHRDLDSSLPCELGELGLTLFGDGADPSLLNPTPYIPTPISPFALGPSGADRDIPTCLAQAGWEASLCQEGRPPPGSWREGRRSFLATVQALPQSLGLFPFLSPGSLPGLAPGQNNYSSRQEL